MNDRSRALSTAAALGRIMVTAMVVGAVGFVLGFFGPMVLTPDANQGPLLGIFITGPLGVLAGFILGVVRELRHRDMRARDLLAPERLTLRNGLRAVAAVMGLILAFDGVIGTAAGVGRPAAAALVVGVALLWFAAAGRIPDWFRR